MYLKGMGCVHVDLCPVVHDNGPLDFLNWGEIFLGQMSNYQLHKEHSAPRREAACDKILQFPNHFSGRDCKGANK
jgi:hypothetical protein